MENQNDYSSSPYYWSMEQYPSHAGYETLEGDIIKRLQDIKKLPLEDQSFQLSFLADEISTQYGEQYDIQIIQDLIDKNL